MKFLPVENIVYKTNLTEDEVKKRLLENVDSWSDNIFSRYNVIFGNGLTTPYEGKIIGRSFKIKTIGRKKNVFRPTISGIIINDVDGSTILVKMRLHLFMLVFLYLLSMLLMGFTAIIQALIWFSDVSPKIVISLAFLLIPMFGMFLPLYAIIMVIFNYGSRKLKTDLAKIFQADIIKE